jgi:EAL domain-containing protein (putative c-di-GMP-specific phosphodiesterase class I)
VDTALVQTVIDLGHTLGLDVVAEGVENAGQAERLRQMGCDIGQGYYFSEPLPVAAAGALLAKGSLP